MAMQVDNATVVFLGLAIVFIGLLAVIALISIVGAIMRKADKKAKANSAAPVSAPAAPAAVDIPNKQEFIAAVSAAIAEDSGTDVTRIRIHKIERV